MCSRCVYYWRIHTHIFLHIYIHIQDMFTYVYIYNYLCGCMYMCIYTYRYIYIYIYMYIHIYTHIHVYVHLYTYIYRHQWVSMTVLTVAQFSVCSMTIGTTRVHTWCVYKLWKHIERQSNTRNLFCIRSLLMYECMLLRCVHKRICRRKRLAAAITPKFPT